MSPLKRYNLFLVKLNVYDTKNNYGSLTDCFMHPPGDSERTL